jgi:hypothetical protein
MIRLTAVLVLLPVSTIDLGFLGALGFSAPPEGPGTGTLSSMLTLVLELAEENMSLAGCRLRPELVSIRELVLELDSELLELAEENILLAGCKLKPELVSKRSLVRELVRELLLELFLKENMVVG